MGKRLWLARRTEDNNVCTSVNKFCPSKIDGYVGIKLSLHHSSRWKCDGERETGTYVGISVSEIEIRVSGL